jgi:DNA replication protein DnaC
MTSVDPIPTTLTANLQRLGLTYTAETLNDLVARGTRSRWSPTVLLDTLVQAELEARARRRLERQLHGARLGRFKPMADFEWDWPKQLHRPTLERVLSLDFIARGENVVLVAPHGLGKTMLAKNLVHQAVLAGHSALFVTASDLLLDLNVRDTSRALERRLRAYARPHVLAIDKW